MESENQRLASGEIAILLEEYRSLRAEAQQRIATNGSLVGFAAAGVAIYATARPSTLIWVVALAVALVLATVWISNLLGLAALSRHLKGLERRIAERTAIAYAHPDADSSDGNVEMLLSWETWRAGDGAGWLRRVGRSIGVTT